MPASTQRRRVEGIEDYLCLNEFDYQAYRMSAGCNAGLEDYYPDRKKD